MPASVTKLQLGLGPPRVPLTHVRSVVRFSPAHSIMMGREKEKKSWGVGGSFHGRDYTDGYVEGRQRKQYRNLVQYTQVVLLCTVK